MTAEKAKLGSDVVVKLQSDPNKFIGVNVNDRGPFMMNGAGKAVQPLQPHPNRVIDLTKKAFEDLTGDLTLGRVPVMVVVPKSRR